MKGGKVREGLRESKRRVKLRLHHFTHLSSWLLAVLGSPTIHTLMSPLSLVLSTVVFGMPPNSIRRTPLLTSSFPDDIT